MHRHGPQRGLAPLLVILGCFQPTLGPKGTLWQGRLKHMLHMKKRNNKNTKSVFQHKFFLKYGITHNKPCTTGRRGGARDMGRGTGMQCARR